MTDVLGMDVVVGMPQMFRRNVYHRIDALVAKYVDDMMIAARMGEKLAKAHDAVKQAFMVGQWVTMPDTMIMNSTELVQTPTAISVSIPSLAKEIEPIPIAPGRRKQITEEASPLEVRSVRTIAGKLGYMGVAVSPLASFAASFLQQSVPEMTVGTLNMLNGVIRDVGRRLHEIQYPQPSLDEQKSAYILIFSDAGYPHGQKKKSIVQEGCIVGVSYGVKAGAKFHTVAWLSRKKRRESTSTMSAETIAAMSAVGTALTVRKVYENTTGTRLSVTLAVDSKGLHRFMATISQPRDRSIIVEVHRLRLLHANGQVARIVWVPGTENPADPFTKPLAGATTAILKQILATERLVHDIDDLRGIGIARMEEE